MDNKKYSSNEETRSKVTISYQIQEVKQFSLIADVAEALIHMNHKIGNFFPNTSFDMMGKTIKGYYSYLDNLPTGWTAEQIGEEILNAIQPIMGKRADHIQVRIVTESIKDQNFWPRPKK